MPPGPEAHPGHLKDSVVDALSNVLAFEAYDAPLRRQSHAESVHHFTDLWFAQMEAI